MGQSNKDLDEVTLGPLSVHIDELTLLRDEIQDLKAECQEQREIIKLQARAFADGKRASPFEDSVREFLRKEHNKLALELIRKLKNDGF